MCYPNLLTLLEIIEIETDNFYSPSSHLKVAIPLSKRKNIITLNDN